MTTGRVTRSLGRLLTLLLVFAFVGVIGSCAITIGIWPGQIKLLAPVFCTDAQPDPFVVADTYSPRPGETVTNFSLYCMGPRGDSTDHGFAKPFLLISVVNGVLIVGGVMLLAAAAGRGGNGERSGHRSTVRDADEDRATYDDVHDVAESPVGTRTARRRRGRRSDAAPPGSTPGPFVD